MNLQESIRKILREEKDQTKLIKGIIDSSDIFDYKHFCGFDIITPEERSDQYNFLNKNKIPYLIKVYFVGGPNSEVWPRTQAIRNKELDLMEELHEYIKSFVPFNIEMMGSHVNSCDGYKKLMKRKYTTDDLQESIRKVLREEFNQLPKYLYHLTSDENYKNILMEGFLNPKYSKQSKRKKGIYLSDDISVAENYRFFYEPNEKVVLLKIKTSSLNEDSFYPDDYELQDFLNDGGWGVDEDIEYSRWYDVPWQLSLKWVNQIQYLRPIPISEIKKI